MVAIQYTADEGRLQVRLRLRGVLESAEGTGNLLNPNSHQGIAIFKLSEQEGMEWNGVEWNDYRE